jgi:GxxExxY protein
MNADKRRKDKGHEVKYAALTGEIIGAFYTVYNALGYGFLEKVYENALAFELRKSGLSVEQQKPITVYYAGQPVGEYFADIVVNEVIILELKAVRQLTDQHEAQLLNYLKATTMEVGLLFNFGPQPELKRKAFANACKGAMEWFSDTDRSE